MPIQLVARSVSDASRSTGKGIFPTTQPFIARLLRTVATWFIRSAYRRALGDLAQDPRLLNDIGLSRDQALREVAKPFWRS